MSWSRNEVSLWLVVTFNQPVTHTQPVTRSVSALFVAVKGSAKDFYLSYNKRMTHSVSALFAMYSEGGVCCSEGVCLLQ